MLSEKMRMNTVVSTTGHVYTKHKWWEDVAALENKYYSLRKAVGQGMADTLHDYEAQVAGLRELLEYAGGILSHGTPGSAWMDWILRVQGQLGIEFHNARFEDGNKIPFSRLEERVAHLPRVYFRELKESLDAD